MALNQDWKEFIESLNENRVEYLIVCAHALAHLGRPRLTGDIDFFVRNSRENAERILLAIHDFGFASLNLQVEDLIADDVVIQLGFPPARIDILTGISGVSFEQAWGNRLHGELGDLPVLFISRQDFIANKKSLGRAKDVADVEALNP